MSRKLLILALLLAVPFFTARAQLFDPEHRSGVEAVVGVSPLQTMMEKYKEELPDGASYVNRMAPAATVSYIFDLNEKWTLQGGLNISRAIFDITYPDSQDPKKEYGTPTFTFLFGTRYHWLRRDHFKVYSGVGFAMTKKVMLAVFFPSPIPTITPIGAHVGTDTIYLTAELSVGGNTLGGVAGLGFRF